MEEPLFATLTVLRMFRGAFGQESLTIQAGGPCNASFRVGDTWLVYARVRDGGAEASVCSRTRLEADASQDLAYLEGLEQGRAQGILHGDVLYEVKDANGRRAALRALFEPLQVVAESAGRRFQVTTDQWGPFQLVLPPGEFDVWVERSGVIVTSRTRVRITDGQDERAMLIASYKE